MFLLGNTKDLIMIKAISVVTPISIDLYDLSISIVVKFNGI